MRLGESRQVCAARLMLAAPKRQIAAGPAESVSVRLLRLLPLRGGLDPDADSGPRGESDEHFEAELLPFASGEVGDVGPAFVLTYPIDETTLTVIEGRSGKRLYEVIYDVSRSG